MNSIINSELGAKNLLNFSIKFSYLMIDSGAEVYRVEDTVIRICKSFNNIKAVNVFATYSMVIISFIYDGTTYTSMRRVNASNKNLEKISLLNDLSRAIVSGKFNIDEAFNELRNIKRKETYSNILKIISLTVCAPFLAIIFGGHLVDMPIAMVAMFIESNFIIYVEKLKFPSFVTTFLSASVVTLTTSLIAIPIDITNISSIIIAGIMPLFPGIQITNSMRDILSGDILSGMMGIISAIFTAVSIALGVVFVLRFFR